MNKERGLSPFAMVDLIEEDMGIMQQDHKDLLNASLVSTLEVKETRTKLIASTPTESEGFMMMLKIFANLLFALYPSSCPFYEQVYEIIKAIREYLPNSRAALQNNINTIILWIIILQARRFAQVKMEVTQG